MMSAVRSKLLISVLLITSEVHACVHLIGAGAGCNDITTVASTINQQAQVRYQTTDPHDGKHPGGSFAVVTCQSIGETLALLENGTSIGYFTPQTLTCNNGVWSNPAIFTCVNVCPFFKQNPTETNIIYNNGVIADQFVVVPGATAIVSCTAATGQAGTMDIFESQSQTAAAGSALTYTCSSRGTWERNGAAVGDVTCKRRCVEPPVTNSGGALSTMEARYTGFLSNEISVSHGTSFPMTLNGASGSTIPCPLEPTADQFAAQIFFTDGTNIWVGSNSAVFSATLTCNDSQYTVEAFTYGGVSYESNTLSHFACE